MMTFMEVKANRGQIQWIIFVLPLWYLVSRWGLGSKVCMHHCGCGNGVNWIKGYYMIVKVKIEINWFSTYSMEMHSLTSSSFIICLWGETFGSRTILYWLFIDFSDFYRFHWFFLFYQLYWFYRFYRFFIHFINFIDFSPISSVYLFVCLFFFFFKFWQNFGVYAAHTKYRSESVCKTESFDSYFVREMTHWGLKCVTLVQVCHLTDK